jgi:hypothetical protein
MNQRDRYRHGSNYDVGMERRLRTLFMYMCRDQVERATETRRNRPMIVHHADLEDLTNSVKYFRNDFASKSRNFVVKSAAASVGQFCDGR